MKKIILATSLALATTATFSATPGDVATIMKADYPNIKVIGVEKTPVAEIFEVDVDNNGRKMVIYTDAGATYFFTGMINGRTKANITESRNAELNTVAFEDLPLKNAIKTVRGDGSRQIAVFADPNCGYCKKIEAEFENIDNVTVYTFLVGILGESSKEKAESIWCAGDKPKALRASLVEKQQVPTKTCANPLNANLDLFRKLGFEGTPSMVLKNGKTVPGYLAADQLNKLLDSAE